MLVGCSIAPWVVIRSRHAPACGAVLHRIDAHAQVDKRFFIAASWWAGREANGHLAVGTDVGRVEST